jgi:HSP20 family protein
VRPLTMIHRGRPLGEVLDWLDWPLISLLVPAGHPMRAEDYVMDDQYVLRAELPGCDPEKDIEVTASRGVLTIRSQRREEPAGRHHSEFHYGTFVRSFRLPHNADESRIRSIYGHGILEVTADLTSDAGRQEGRRVPVMVNHHIDPT